MTGAEFVARWACYLGEYPNEIALADEVDEMIAAVRAPLEAQIAKLETHIAGLRAYIHDDCIEPSIATKHYWICNLCGYEWKADGRSPEHATDCICGIDGGQKFVAAIEQRVRRATLERTITLAETTACASLSGEVVRDFIAARLRAEMEKETA